MAKHHAEEPEKENSERWLLTYADLITLLMAFFMVLYAMSQVDLKKYRGLKGSLFNAFNRSSATTGGVLGSGTGKVFGEGSGSFAPPPVKVTPPDLKRVDPEFRQMATKMQQYRSTAGIEASARVTFDERGMVVQLDNSLLFPAGSAQLTAEARHLLDNLAEMLQPQTNHIRVEGHTDDTPIHTTRYPSNWQLSTDRAANVIQYWVEKGDLPPERLSAAGYGKYRPVVPNDSPAHRSLNRRVEIVILRRSLTKLEPQGKPTPGEVGRYLP